MRLLLTFLLSFKVLYRTSLMAFIMLFSACAGIPAKPSVELGVIDYPANQVIINTTGKLSINTMPDLHYKALSQEIKATGGRVPLSSYDKAVSFKPVEWEKIQNYMDALVRYAQNGCGQ